MDLSLDDIIKKNNKKTPQKLRGRLHIARGGRRTNATSRSTKPLQINNGRVSRLPHHLPKTGDKSVNSFSRKPSAVPDARIKIIQKNRLRLGDAREKLSELAKQTDARTKIKGRSLLVPQKLDTRRDRRPVSRASFNREPSKHRPPLLQRSIRNNAADMRDPSSLIRCTINQPMEDYSKRPSPVYEEDIDMPFPARPRNDLSSIKVVTQNEYTHFGQPHQLGEQTLTTSRWMPEQEYVPSILEQPMYIDHYESPVFNRQLDPPRGSLLRASGLRMSQEMRARLDTPTNPSSLYSFPPSSLGPMSTLGHRIVVSNLQPTVTNEDIKELFEDIGQLVTSRLVRPGTAEVIYKLQKDAKKAVEAYHNRQLDGQPMKCLLVNPRPLTGTSGVLRSTNMPITPKFPSSSKSTVVPDLSAIHKALFTSK